jgi:hypothetical protein
LKKKALEPQPQRKLHPAAAKPIDGISISQGNYLNVAEGSRPLPPTLRHLPPKEFEEEDSSDSSLQAKFFGKGPVASK